MPSLPMYGEIAPASPSQSMPLLAKGFRPFFVLAAGFAASIVPLWVLFYLGFGSPPTYLDPTYWHAHEMLFGFTSAVIAGFLLTAVGNWTSRETLTGAPLGALATIWLMGRIAMTFGSGLPKLVLAGIDLLFLPLLVVVLARPIVASKNKRNGVMLGFLALLFFANLAIHLDALGFAPGWRRRGALVALDVVILMISVIAGRVFPMFTRNATSVQGIRSRPRLDVAAVVLMALLTLLDALDTNLKAISFVAALAGAFAFARMLTWGGAHTFREPMLWVLHIGYLWVPVGLFLRVASQVWPRILPSIGLHALAVGAVGTLTLGMMARVTLGHTGRTIVASGAIAASFVAITISAVVRVVGAIAFPLSNQTVITAAGTFWTFAFVLFLAANIPILFRGRVDGKIG